VAIATFLCGTSHDLGMDQCEGGKQSQKNVLLKHICEDVGYKVKIALLLKGTFFRFSNHMKFNETT
jgi:hypothetical protein